MDSIINKDYEKILEHIKTNHMIEYNVKFMEFEYPKHTTCIEYAGRYMECWM